MVCYLFDCGTPSVCTFSTKFGFSTVQLSARNLHPTESPLVNDNKYGTKLTSTTAQFLSTAANSLPSTTTSVVDDRYIHRNKTGESFHIGCYSAYYKTTAYVFVRNLLADCHRCKMCFSNKH